MSAMSVLDPVAELRRLVTVFPSGALRVDLSGDEDTGLSAAARARVAAAFERGVGHGLLDLGTTEVDTPLIPEVAFLRDLHQEFLRRGHEWENQTPDRFLEAMTAWVGGAGLAFSCDFRPHFPSFST